MLEGVVWISGVLFSYMSGFFDNLHCISCGGLYLAVKIDRFWNWTSIVCYLVKEKKYSLSVVCTYLFFCFFY